MIKKIAPVFFGILLIILFESSLYFTGKIFLYARNINPHLQNKEFDELILCIGDSHTFGVGTLSKYSYPNQLKMLLNLNNPETSFNVVNLGIPGNSTKDQVERLEALLNKSKTELVILLTGRNNYFEANAWGEESFLTHSLLKLQKIRTYKIVKYALDRYFKIGRRVDINAFVEEAKYEDYMRVQLLKAKMLCQKHGCRLLLISYYNNHYKCIAKIAEELGVVYVNLYQDFFKDLPQDEIIKLVSPDSSHMNCCGYGIFAQVLYKKMHLHRKNLALQLNRLSNEITETDLCEHPPLSYLRYVQGKSVFY